MIRVEQASNELSSHHVCGVADGSIASTVWAGYAEVAQLGLRLKLGEKTGDELAFFLL